MHRARVRSWDPVALMLLVLSAGGGASAGEQKYLYATESECGRFSAAAVYHEKFEPITRNMIQDSNEFVSRVADAVEESLSMVMSQLPDKDFSEKQDSRMVLQFRALKKSFAAKTRKAARNMTVAWEALLADHLDLMMDRGKTSLQTYLAKARDLADSYSAARTTLDLSMASFVGHVKSTVRDSLRGIEMATQEALKKNASDAQGESDQKEMSEEEKLTAKKLEIAEMVVQGFLGKVTLEVIRRKTDLFKRADTKPEDRDNVMDDVLFDILMVRNRVAVIAQPDLLPDDKGAIDLARRSIYMHWADLAEKMDHDKIESRKNEKPPQHPHLFYKNMWEDDDQLSDTLLSLMELYP